MHPFEIEVLDLATPKGIGRAGSLFAPAIFVDGEPFSYGRLSEPRLRRRLARDEARA